jgi:hypothetical protein
MITVPSCNLHNNKHSGVDERLRMLAAMEVSRNAGGERILQEKVLGSTIAKGRQIQLTENIFLSMRKEFVQTPGGPKGMVRFTFSGAKELMVCIADITRGLLAYFYPDWNCREHKFTILDFHTATLAQGNPHDQLRVMEGMKLLGIEDRRGNHNEFRFWRHVEPENEHGAWLLLFYEAVAFTVIHSTALPADIEPD